MRSLRRELLLWEQVFTFRSVAHLEKLCLPGEQMRVYVFSLCKTHNGKKFVLDEGISLFWCRLFPLETVFVLMESK